MRLPEPLSFVCLLIGTLSFTAFAAYSVDLTPQLQEPIWENRAVDVFPDHDQVAKGWQSVQHMIEAGGKLFETRFNVLDGAGRPLATGHSDPSKRRKPAAERFNRIAGPDANSCAGCHNQPASGGSGELSANAFVGAHLIDPPMPLASRDVTNERNTASIFGSGAIELIAREMTEDLWGLRDHAIEASKLSGEDVKINLEAKGISFGRLVAHPDETLDTSGVQGIDEDLVVKPFGAKGNTVSLRQFTNNALNQHHGIQSDERFGGNQTGDADFDGDGIVSEFTKGQVTALVVFQASLPAPAIMKPKDNKHLALLKAGEIAFEDVGCATCHKPVLPLRNALYTEPGPYNPAGNATPDSFAGPVSTLLPIKDGSGVYADVDGNVFVAAFTDLKRHVICDKDDMFFCNERLEQDSISTDEFVTARLWDTGTSAPYGHRGDLTTVSEAIRHHSGEAKKSKRQFLELEDETKRAVVAYLQSMVVE